MRLICPNCEAEYEVPDDVVPEAGRDVQCSACGQTWFATPEGVSPPEPIEDAPPFDDEDSLVADPGAPDPDAPETDFDAEDDLDAPLPDPAQPHVRRRLDPEVTDVLRQERETSEALKRGEHADFETSGGESDDGTAKTVAAAAAATAAAATGSSISRARSRVPQSDAASQLPDVDEINSTLRPDGRRSERRQRQKSERGGRDQAPAKKGGSGFRIGFLIVVLIALIGFLIYWQAPRLAEMFPGAAVSLGNYVITVDNGRIWLDETLASLTGGA